MADSFIWTPITLLGNLLFITIYVILLHTVLTRRFSTAVTVAGCAACWVLSLLCSTLLPYASLAGYLSSILNFFAPALLFFRDKWYKSLFVAVMSVVFVTAADLISVSLLYPPEVLKAGIGTQTPLMQAAGYALYLPLYGLFTWLFALILKRYENQLSAAEWLLYPLFPFSQFVLLYGWLAAAREAMTHSRVGFLLAAMAICLTADAVLFYTIRSLAQRGRIRRENELFSRQLTVQKSHYSALIAQYETVRRLRHDIAGHLYTVERLLDRGDYANARDYAARVQDACTPSARPGLCENPIVDAFLSARADELRALGFRLDLQLSLPAHSGISDTDLIIAFSNLVENAVEACRDAEQQYLRVRAAREKGFLFIEVQNPISEPTSDRRGRIPGLERGVGFRILDELAGRYQGSFTYKGQAGVFSAHLILKEEP